MQHRLALVEISKWPARYTKKKPRTLRAPASVRLRLWCSCGVGSAVLSYAPDEVPSRVRLARLLMRAYHPGSPLYVPELHTIPGASA